MSDFLTFEFATSTSSSTCNLKVISVSGHEAVSECFDFKLKFVATDGVEIDGSDLVGTFGTLGIARHPDYLDAEHSRRYIRGVIRRFATVENEDSEFPAYEADLVPWFWLTKHRLNSRVFQNMTALAIVEEILGEWQDGNSEEVAFDKEKLTATYTTLNYCVQYRESDFDFVSRILEREGIFYYFDWTNGKTTLVLGDDNVCFNPANEGFVDSTTAGPFTDVILGDRGLSNWTVEHQFVQDNPSVGEFNYLSPSTVHEWPSTPSIEWLPGSRDLAQGYVDRWPEDVVPEGPSDNIAERGRTLESISQAARDVTRSKIEVTTGYGHLQAGRELVDQEQLEASHENYFDKAQHLVLRVTHHATQPHTTSSATYGIQDHLCTLVCLPASQGYRPPQLAKKPVVDGPQTAIVVGSNGVTGSLNTGDCEGDYEAATDSLGRVKVKFHWDASTECEDTSCWVRVSQVWAGQGYGSFQLPHVGHEVVVSFLEGDPDRPLITGRVYNSSNRVSQVSRPDDEGTELVSKSFNDLTNQTHLSIVGRDQAGNEIHLDSREGEEHILVSSPGQTSYVRVGNTDGIIVRTAGGITELFDGWDIRYTYANSWYLTVGVAAEARLGGDLNLLVGSSFDCFLGSRLSVAAGFDAAFTLAGRCEFSAGAVYSVSKEATLHESKDDVETRSDGDITLDAKSKVLLVGGPNEGTFGRYCSDSTGVAITFGSGPVVDPGGAGWKVGLAGFVAAAASVAAAVAVPVATATAVSTNPPDDKELLDGADNTALLIEGGVALGGSIAAAIALKAMSKAAKLRLRTAAHTVTNSGVELTSTGASIYFSDPKHEVVANANGILLNTASNVSITPGGQATITSPTINLNGTVMVNGQNLVVNQ